MAGILNKRTRFVDLVVTSEGKRQIANGNLRAEFASLSDASVAYESNMVSDDVKKRIYFQVMEKPENVIVLEKDDSGRLVDFDFSPSGSLVGESIFASDENAQPQDLHKLKLSTGSQFASLSEGLPKTFLRHFKNHQFVGTAPYNENSEFVLSKKDLFFAISNSVPFQEGPKKEIVNVNEAESFMFDPKLTHLNNFSYLPPQNVDGTKYGTYQDLRNLNKETWADIKESLGLKHFEEIDSLAEENDDLRIDKLGDYKILNRKKLLPTNTTKIKEFEVINFKKTSDHNSILMQVFETDPNRSKIKKLDIIDAGEFIDDEDVNQRFEKRVFYVGKIFFDSFNSPTFINIFTIVMD